MFHVVGDPQESTACVCVFLYERSCSVSWWGDGEEITQTAAAGRISLGKRQSAACVSTFLTDAAAASAVLYSYDIRRKYQ